MGIYHGSVYFDLSSCKVFFPRENVFVELLEIVKPPSSISQVYKWNAAADLDIYQALGYTGVACGEG